MNPYSAAVEQSKSLVFQRAGLPSLPGWNDARDLPLLRLWQGIETRLTGQRQKVVQIAPCTEAETDRSLAPRLGSLVGRILGGGVVVLRDGQALGEGGFGLAFGPLPGRTVSGSLRALDPALLTAYWEHLRQQVDLVIIDSPPVLSSAVSLALAPTVDGVVLVVAAEQTRMAVARAARDALVSAQAKVLGIVLSNRSYPVPKALYDWL